MQQEELE